MAETLLRPMSPANLFDLPHFVITPHVKRIMDLCQVLQQTRTLGLLIGLPGVGKTWSVQYAAQNQPQPEALMASPVLYTTIDVKNTPSMLLRNLLDCLGPNYRTPMADLTRAVCCWIHRRQVALIILDEADRLDKTSWEIVRDIHDRTHCAFLFVGQPNLLPKLQPRDQLLNRISLTLEMRPLLFDELLDFLKQWQHLRFSELYRRGSAEFCIYPDDTSKDLVIVKEVYQVTLGNLRRVCYFVQEAERIATINGQAYVELPVIHATVQLLLGHGGGQST